MWSPEELELILHYQPLLDAELRRLGVSEDDQRWIHAGSDQVPTTALLERELLALRSLPDGIGPRAYCRYLGFDYDQAKRDLLIP